MSFYPPPPLPPQRSTMSYRSAILLVALLVGGMFLAVSLDPHLPDQIDQLANWMQHCHFSCPAR